MCLGFIWLQFLMVLMMYFMYGVDLYWVKVLSIYVLNEKKVEFY